MARRRSPLAVAVRAGDRRRTLVSLAGLLAEQLDGQQTGHVGGCECRCGVPVGNPRVVGALAKQLAAVLAEIAKIDAEEPAGDGRKAPVDEVAERRRKRRGENGG
jgi:hypothetical protein